MQKCTTPSGLFENQGQQGEFPSPWFGVNYTGQPWFNTELCAATSKHICAGENLIDENVKINSKNGGNKNVRNEEREHS